MCGIVIQIIRLTNKNLIQIDINIQQMDDQSPLAMQFKQFDTDGDGKLNLDEVYELLKLLGKNIYKGSVSSAASLINSVGDDPSQSLMFTFAQFKQFYQSLDNPLKHDIWKGRYKILDAIREVREATGKKQQLATAAPGAKPAFVQQSPFRGDIEITVGPTNQNYNSFVHVNLQKMPKAQSKPFIKIVFEQSSPESAKDLQSKIKKFQASLFELMKSSDPESAEILDYIHIITNVSQSKLNVFITTSNESLIELGTIASQFIDRALGAKFEAKLDFKYEFSVDINKFIDKTSDYSFYHALTQNYHFKLVWNALNFKQNTKEVFKAMEGFKDFKYDKLDPGLLTLIGLLHTEVCEVNLVFDNADFVTAELDTKNQILQGLSELQVKMTEQTENLGLYEALSSFENKLSVQASIGDWKAQANIRIQDLKELLSKKLLPEQNENQNQNPPLVVNVQNNATGVELVSIPHNQDLSCKSSSSGSFVKPSTPIKKPLNSPKSSLKKQKKQKSVDSAKKSFDSSNKSVDPRKKSAPRKTSSSKKSPAPRKNSTSGKKQKSIERQSSKKKRTDSVKKVHSPKIKIKKQQGRGSESSVQ